MHAGYQIVSQGQTPNSSMAPCKHPTHPPSRPGQTFWHARSLKSHLTVHLQHPNHQPELHFHALTLRCICSRSYCPASCRMSIAGPQTAAEWNPAEPHPHNPTHKLKACAALTHASPRETHLQNPTHTTQLPHSCMRAHSHLTSQYVCSTLPTQPN